MDFSSDNVWGAAPEILAALTAANTGSTAAYGADDWTKRAEARLAEIFERECAVFLVATGTAANALALAALTPPWGAVFCHETAHVADDECGAPEFYTAGAKLVGIPGPSGKIAPEGLAQTLARYPRGLVKQVQPAAVSLSQATECGTIYTPDEISALTRVAHDAGLPVHMDGARFANALVTLGCTPAQMTWKAGVDVLSFGATKNGALACEAVIFFDPARATDFAFRRKRGGHTLSKGRVLGAQMLAYLEGDLWLDLARRANAAAARLEAGLRSIPGVRLPWARGANEVFAVLPAATTARLRTQGARFGDWDPRGVSEAIAEDEAFVRLVTAFSSDHGDIDRFVDLLRRDIGSDSSRFGSN